MSDYEHIPLKRKHDSAPWVWYLHPDNKASVGLWTKDGSRSIIVPDIFVDRKGDVTFYVACGEENRDLISAAPDLLEACKAVTSYFELADFSVNVSEMVDQANAAIAKAEGEV